MKIWVAKMDNQPIGHFHDRSDAVSYLERVAKELVLTQTGVSFNDGLFQIEDGVYQSFVTLIKGEMTRATLGSAGWDIHAGVDIMINPGEQKIVTTEIITAMSMDRCCFIVDRSGMAAKMRLTKRAGLIDSDYLKVWDVVLCNESDSVREIKKGNRIAQALFLPVIPDSEFHGVGFNRLYLNRESGFGSTGV